ncbi:Asparagine--tRNA ligase [Paragonimus heterotremus]|uniref:Asparagine--tRNA ligase n=1 Tax=Paragonimus heterotremus TaxID=100268 RepID=A0A8J4WVQ0_9TREM|nr:Asparagine--tRNA ligase [Paragonimus heterotremus]
MWRPVCWVAKLGRCRTTFFSSGWSHITVTTCSNISNAVGSIDAVPEPGIPVTLVGWVRSIRRHKTRVFFNLNDGSTARELQVVCCPTTIRGAIHVGSAVAVKGHLVSSQPDSTRVVSSLTANLLLHGEVLAKDVRPLDSNSSLEISESRRLESPGGSSTPRPDLGLLRSAAGLPWRHRLPEFAAVLRLRAKVKNLVQQVMQKLEYLEVDTPIMTTLDCEGTNQTFSVRASNEGTVGPIDHSPATVRLTGSSQLHLEALALGLSKNSFRENAASRFRMCFL